MAIIECRVCGTKVRFDLEAAPEGRQPICPRCKTPLRAMSTEARHKRVSEADRRPGAGTTGVLLELKEARRLADNRDLRRLAERLGPIRRALKSCAPFDPRRKFQAEITTFTESLLAIGVNEWHSSMQPGRPGEAFVEKVFEDISGILPLFQDPGHSTVGQLLRMLELASSIPQSHYRRLCVIFLDTLIRLPMEGREDGVQDALEKLLSGEFTNTHVRSELIRAMGWTGHAPAIRKLLSREGRAHPEHLYLAIYLLGPKAFQHLARLATDDSNHLEHILDGLPHRTRPESDRLLAVSWLANPDRVDLGAVELATLAGFFGGRTARPFLNWLDSTYALPSHVIDEAIDESESHRFANEVLAAGINRRYPSCALFSEDWTKWGHNTFFCRSLKNALDLKELDHSMMDILDREDTAAVLGSLNNEIDAGYVPLIEGALARYVTESKPVIIGCLGCGTKVRVKPDTIPIGKQPICPKCGKSIPLKEGQERAVASAQKKTSREVQLVDGMVLIPEGVAVFGSDRMVRGVDPWERPAHEVRMHSFLIDQYPVTNDEYRRFKAEHHFQPGKGRHPVVNVTRSEAEAYSKWAGKRLPTEMEWERAARGSDERNWPWGDKFLPNRANTSETGKFATTEVDAFPDGASIFGVMDMIGNVWEWTGSWYLSYPGARRPFDYTGQQAVVRSGTCFEDQSRNRVSRRHYLPPDTRNATLGFRCAKNA